MKWLIIGPFSLLVFALLFLYIFYDYQPNKDGSVQLLSYPIMRPFFRTHPTFSLPPGIKADNGAAAPGHGPGLTLSVDLDIYDYFEVIVDGRKTLLIQNDDPDNIAYYFDKNGTKHLITGHRLVINVNGELEMYEGDVSHADEVYLLALGKMLDRGINVPGIFLKKQFEIEPKPWYVPLPYLRSRRPWKIELKTDKGRWVVNEYIYIWR
jgi:hypothetical protein